jgi:hypothetical protein
VEIEFDSPCWNCIEKPCQFLDNDVKCVEYKKWKRSVIKLAINRKC